MFKRCGLPVIIITKRTLYRATDSIYVTPDAMKEALQNKDNLSSSDWKILRRLFLENNNYRNQFTLRNIDALTMGVCTSLKKYNLAFSYLKFLNDEKIPLNLATSGKLLKLYSVKCWDIGLTKTDEEQIIKIYDDLRKSYPVLDYLSLDSIIPALALTRNWKECLKLLDESRISAPPTVNAYSAIIAAAFLNSEEQLAWKLTRELLDQDKYPQEIVYLAYMKNVENKQDLQEKIEKMFNFLHETNLKITMKVAGNVEGICNQFGLNCKITSIHSNGTCRNCRNILNSFEPNDQEFDILKDKIMEKAIIGRDLFAKTSPEEVDNLESFIKDMPRFDVVVDGLNVAYTHKIKNPEFQSKMVKSVVSYFVNDGLNVLVLGRQHMNKWPKHNWNYIQTNATLFLTQNISHDDPYLLYCALKSGRNTKIITKDLMRTHKFLLGNLQLKLLFQKWLNQRQWQLLGVHKNGTVKFKSPLPYSEVAQKISRYWHVPIEADEGVIKWLCLKIN